MSMLRQKMIKDMELRGYSPKTQEAYIRYVIRYAEHFNKSPDSLGTDEIREYLHHLITVKEASKSYVNLNLFSTTLVQFGRSA